MTTERGETAIRLVVNNEPVDVSVPADELLVTTLRDRLGQRSVRPTCGVGACGTCTVQLDGLAASSCLLLTVQVSGQAIRTSEGLVESDGTLSAVQQAFVEAAAFQCSYCIPGMVLTVDACLRARPDATLDDVRISLSGNLCRCGSYNEILAAVRALVMPRGPAADSP